MRRRLLTTFLVFCMTLTLFPAYALEEETVDGVIPGSEERIGDELGTDEASSGLADTPHSTDEDSQNAGAKTASPAGAADVTDTLAGQESPAESGLAVLFENSDTMTRGAWMRELVNLFGLTLKKDEYPDVYFPDIAESEYFDDIMVATKYGFVDVEAGDTFEPEAPLTREYAAWTLNFYLGIQNDKDRYTFSDADDLAYPDDAQVAVDCGWFSLNGGRFSPKAEVTAEEVAVMREYAAQLLAGRTTTGNIADYEFADFVKIIPNTAKVASRLDIETGTRTVVITDYDGALSNGDTFAYYYEDFAFVFSVKSVQDQDGVFTVITEDAPEGAILKYEFAGTIEPEITDFIPDSEPVTLMAADGDTVTFGEAKLLSIKDKSITFGRDIFKSNGVKGTLTGKIDHLALDTKFITAGRKYAVLSGDITISSSVDIDLINDSAVSKGLPLGKVGLDPFGYADVELQLKWNVNFSFTYKASFKLGAEYENGKGSIIKDWNTSPDNCFSAKGTISAQLALNVSLDFGANGYAFATLSAGPIMTVGMKQYAAGTPRQCLTGSGYLYAGLVIRVKLQEALTQEVLYKYDKDIIFYNQKNSPFRYYTHVEDGVEVPSCTRGLDAGTTTGTYQTPKYTTPSNSRYYASSSTAASSTGYGGYGSTEPVVIWQTSDNDDGTVTITGYSGSASILNIPETIDGKTVTVIGNAVFKQNTKIRIANIPDTVTSIKSDAFNVCTNLQTVSFSSNLTEIDGFAFYGCSSLDRIELPERLVRLGECAFSECVSAEYVFIPSTLEQSYSNYGRGPFSGCERLDNVEFGNGLPVIAPCLFMACSGLTHIDIPDTVTSIKSDAFNVCTNLQTVSFSSNLTEIDGFAFYGCSSLDRIELPERLVRLGECAFSECVSAEYVFIPSTLEQSYSNYGRGPFSGCERLDNVEFGNGLPVIAPCLFMACSGLTHIDIPDTVTSIDRDAFCNSGLRSLIIPDTITNYTDGILQDCDKLESIQLSVNALTIPSSMFSGCSALNSIEIPNGVTEIKNRTFYGCSSLKSVTLPDSVTTIGDGAFYGCASLTDLTWMPYTVTSVSNHAFENCTGLTSAELPDLVSSLGEGVFKGCTSLAAFHGGADLLTIGAYCFQDCAALTDVDLVDGLATIRDCAFQNCTKLETIVLPDSVTSIGTYIFQKDPALKDVTLSKGLTVIPSYAFANCIAMTELTIPKGVTTIRDHAFYQDTALKTFTIPESVVSIENNAFSYPTATTVHGVAGSYAETYAKWQSFIDMTKTAADLALASGSDSMTIGWGIVVTPLFVFAPADSTELVTLVSDDPDVVYVEEDGISIRGNREGTAHVTATTSSGRSFTFAVTVSSMEGIEIGRSPDQTSFDVGARKDLSGLVVNAVFSNGDREQIYDHTVSGFTTDRAGTYIVTAAYDRWTASFLIIVGGGDPGLKSGIMGNSGELHWTYRESTGQLTVTGPVDTNDVVFATCYDANGKMLSAEPITASGGTVQIVSRTSTIALSWLDSRLAPKCGKETIHCS